MRKIAILIIILFVFAIGLNVLYYNTAETITVSVKDKERITTGSGEDISSKFIVYTKNEVFENTDSFLFWKLNSADVQNSLDKEKMYQIKVVGWRIPFFSSYRNIISVKEISE